MTGAAGFVRRAAMAALGVSALSVTSAAQLQERIPDAVTCTRCTITSKSLVTMQPPEDVVADRPQLVQVDNAGRYWMFFEAELPAVYEPSGNFLKSIGRKGAGPGEFRFPGPMLAARDSVAVFDASNGRVTVLDASLTPRRHISLPWQVMYPVVIDWPNAVVGSAIRDQRSAAPDPLQIISLAGPDAAVTKTFGSRVAPSGGFSAFSASHLVVRSSPGRLWAAWTQGYDIAEWTADGTLVRAFQRRPSWFPSTAPSTIGTPMRAPDSFVTGIERDSNGLLWVFLRTPKVTWKQGWPVLQSGQREVSSRSFDYGKMWATTIEVIDPDAGRVVARQVIDRLIISAVSGRRAAFFSRDATGLGQIEILEFTLNGR
jgi:hypothetical protein